MPNWYGARDEQFAFRRVTWPNMAEVGEYSQITGGSVELSALSDLKASGSLDFEGDSAPANGDLVRIYYSFRDDAGAESEHVLATMFAYCAEPEFDGAKHSGKMELTSVLAVLSKKKLKRPYTVQAGTLAVQHAVALAEGLGLVVSVSGDSGYVLSADHTFEPSDSYLTVVNWLLGAAGYASCMPDSYGAVQMAPYVEPTERAESAAFADDEQSIMYPEIAVKNDYSSTPNVVSLIYETDSETLQAQAENVDPTSPASTANTYESTLHETVNELAGEDGGERLANLVDMARRKLLDNSSEIEYVTMQHAWLPLMPNDAVRIDYKAANLEWRGAVTNLSISLKPSIPCELTARRFIRRDLAIETSGEVIWSDAS